MTHHLLLPFDTTLDRFQNSELSLPFSEDVCQFVRDLSSALLKPGEHDAMELKALAYWFRPSQLERLQAQFTKTHDGHTALPVGTVFQIAPGNTDIQYMYTALLSVLLGNRIAVRLSSKQSGIQGELFNVLAQLLSQERYVHLRERMLFFRCDHDAEIITSLSTLCNLRMLWGSNESIAAIRQTMPASSAKDIAFGHRTSLSLVNAESLLDDGQLAQFVDAWLRDVLTFEQQACSSPKALVWVGGRQSIESARSRLYDAIERATETAPSNTFALHQTTVAQALTMTISGSLSSAGSIQFLQSSSSNASVLKHLTHHTGGGVMVELAYEELDVVADCLPRCQTLTYFGFERESLCDAFGLAGLSRFDRIEPVGSALEFHYIWDGYNFLHEFCKSIR